MHAPVVLPNSLVTNLAGRIANNIKTLNPYVSKVYGIPRGGIPAALAVIAQHGALQLVDDPKDAHLFIDDLIDSGATCEKWSDKYPGVPFYALLDKRIEDPWRHRWVVFPWEVSAEAGIEDNIVRLLQFIGENPSREGLLDTPLRVAKAWEFWTSGYGKDPADVLKVFEDGGENYDEMVVVKDIPVYSKCEHHLADIFGTATIAYIPDGRIIGLSKVSRLTEVFARRLQVQERLTSQIADAIDTHLKPKGVGVIITARHMCMESRGICQQGHHTITSALRGVIKDKPETRAEFMSLL